MVGEGGLQCWAGVPSFLLQLNEGSGRVAELQFLAVQLERVAQLRVRRQLAGPLGAAAAAEHQPAQPVGAAVAAAADRPAASARQHLQLHRQRPGGAGRHPRGRVRAERARGQARQLQTILSHDEAPHQEGHDRVQPGRPPRQARTPPARRPQPSQVPLRVPPQPRRPQTPRQGRQVPRNAAGARAFPGEEEAGAEAEERERSHSSLTSLILMVLGWLQLMGGFFTSLFGRLAGKRELKIIIIGLDNSGKTTVLNTLHLNEVKQTVPTIGFNMEVVHYKNLHFQVWDLGGQNSIRQYWEMYYPNTNAILYVVDSTDRQRFAKAAEELAKVLEKEILQGVPLLVLANKLDLPEAAGEKEISEVLGLAKIKERDWAIYRCSATSGKGLNQSLDWVVEKLTPLL